MKTPKVKPNQIWLVTYECRIEAIRISPKNDGFYAPGQEVKWDFSNISDWIKCLYDPEIEETSILELVNK